MQVLVMNLVLCFYFVNFSTTKYMCMCVNFAAFINREDGKVKFKFIKKCIFYHSLCRVVAMYAIVGVVNTFMHRVGFYKKHEPR